MVYTWQVLLHLFLHKHTCISENTYIIYCVVLCKQAVDELYKMMRLMAARYADSSEEEIRAVNTFRRTTICMYIHDLEARTHWQTLIS